MKRIQAYDDKIVIENMPAEVDDKEVRIDVD